MEFLSPEDYLEIRLASILTDFDRKVLCELYQPLVGFPAVALFFTLWSEREQGYSDVSNHERLLNLMQMSAGQFAKARGALEAVGLLKTFYKEENNIRFFTYELYAPKSPALFFEDALFAGLLSQYLGEKEASRLSIAFRGDDRVTGQAEISARFADIFHPDLNDAAFKVTPKSGAKRRQSGKLDITFDFNLFFQASEAKGMLKKTAFSKAQLDEIERVATLYGIDEETMAEHVLSAYSPEAPKENRIDFYRLGDLCREESRYPFARKKVNNQGNMPTSATALAEKVKLMETISPKDYLRVKQNNTSPAKPDLILIDDLSGKFALPNSVINALVDYVLAVNKNVLSRALCEKIAASLAREKIVSALDAMNYLKSVLNRRKTVKPETKHEAKPEEVEVIPTPEKPAEPAQNLEELEKVLAKYKKKEE